MCCDLVPILASIRTDGTHVRSPRSLMCWIRFVVWGANSGVWDVHVRVASALHAKFEKTIGCSPSSVRRAAPGNFEPSTSRPLHTTFRRWMHVPKRISAKSFSSSLCLVHLPFPSMVLPSQTHRPPRTTYRMKTMRNKYQVYESYVQERDAIFAPRSCAVAVVDLD